MANCLFDGIHDELQISIKAKTTDKTFLSEDRDYSLLFTTLKNQGRQFDGKEITTIQEYESWVQSTDQDTHAAVLRQLSIDYIKENYPRYQREYQEILWDAFVDFVKTKQKKPMQGKTDDTFIYHESLKNKFEELYSKNENIDIENSEQVETVRENLLNFWEETGKNSYFKTLSEKEKTTDIPSGYLYARRGSHVEYDAICTLLGLRGKHVESLKSGETLYPSVGIAHGELTTQDFPTNGNFALRSLLSRNIGTFHGNLEIGEGFLRIQIQSHEELKKQLGAVPFHEEIMDFLKNAESSATLETLIENLKSTSSISEEQEKEIRSQLKEHGIVTETGTFIKDPNGNIDISRIKNRICSLDKIAPTVIDKHREENPPTISLTHLPDHWKSTNKASGSTLKSSKIATGIGTFDHAMFQENVTTLYNNNVITSCQATLSNGAVKSVIDLTSAEYENVMKYDTMIEKEKFGGGHIQHDIPNKYTLSGSDDEKSVLAMMKTIASGGFKKVEISELLKDPNDQNELLSTCLAASLAGLEPQINKQAVDLSKLDQAQMEEKTKNWDSLLSQKEKENLNSAMRPQMRA